MLITDPEILKFIADTHAIYPDETNFAPVEENRKKYNAMAEYFRAPRPAGLHVNDEQVAGLPIRRYTPVGFETRPFLLYSHGGGFVVGGLETHDDVCAELADATGCEVVATDYRLAPEHSFPAQIDDVSAVWLAETANGRKGIAIGDSGGGTLSAALCFRMRCVGGKMPLAQVLIYPSLGGPTDTPAYVQNAEAPFLPGKEVIAYRNSETPEVRELRRTNPEVAPLVAKSFAGLPPAFLVTADVDPLRDDAPAYQQALHSEGIRAEWRNELQLVHGFLRARHSSKRAAASFKAICDWINDFL